MNHWFSRELCRIIPAGEICVLDIGCGTGYTRGLLAQSGFTGRYVGVDIAKHAKFEGKNVPDFESTFVQARIEDFETKDTFDLVISMTALEHIENDYLAVLKCKGLLKPGAAQIHVIPSLWALPLYLWHGYRQYNPRSIRKLFNCESGGCKVYRLGGLFSFFLHLFFITIPVFIFKRDNLRKLELYPKLRRACNLLDRILPICSSLYIVTVKEDYFVRTR